MMLDSNITAGDLDADGHVDLVVKGTFSGLRVLLGDGKGGFVEQRYATGGGPANLVLADVNGDGRLDVLTANASGSLTELLNRVAAVGR